MLVKRSGTLLFVTKGFTGFCSLSGEFLVLWKEAEAERMLILLFGVVPCLAAPDKTRES